MTVQQAFELALQHHQAGRLAEAEALYRQILTARPNHFDTLHMLGVIAHQIGRNELAVQMIQQAIVLNPHFPAAHSNLGAALRAMDRLDESIASYQRAIELKPNYPEAHSNLGNALWERGLPDEAATACRRAIELKPDYAEAHSNLGNALRDRGQIDEAIAAYRRALELEPHYAKAHNNVGSALWERGQLDEAAAAYRQSLRLNPDDAKTHSDLVFTLQFLSPDNKKLTQEQERWNERFGEPAQRFIVPHANDRNPERRLRIGYVSPDFRKHAVGWNLMPLFERHDHREFEILCYSGVRQPDEVTTALQKRSGQWRSTVGASDEALTEMIRQDAVDILVDLSQHTGGNRLPVFARRSAPVQASFAGYPASTGMRAIGYRISDRYLESGIESQKEHVFLLDSFWCYDPCGTEVKINELPASESGRVTFGSLNNFCKINEPQLRLWARVSRHVAESRLVMLCGLGSHRQRTVEVLEHEGIEAGRVQFVERLSRQEYLEIYRRLDIVLDTFPYNGHSTSLDALWMGVPVVSLAGQSAVSRAGLSQLSNLGLPELVAFSGDEFVEIAVRLAHDLPRLAELRRTLRVRMEASVLMDAPRFAHNIEAAYRAMWRQWCMEKIGAQ